MNYRIYTQTRDGLHLQEVTSDWRTVSAYKACCLNIIVKDSANDLPSDLESITCEQYGVKEGTLYGAGVVMACIVLMPLLGLLAWLTQ